MPQPPGPIRARSLGALQQQADPVRGRFRRRKDGPEYLRGLIECLGCGRRPGEDGYVEHGDGCRVARNLEGGA